MDALAASPFALLDAHGSLRLVTDAVHEDDALCLALACRALRDVLRARFPACPRAGCRAVARLAAEVTADGVLDRRHLHSIDVDGGLRALPEGVGRLAYLPAPGLKKLILYGNRNLTALPAGLCALAALEELNLHDCGLTALPEGIGRLVRLKKLNLIRNYRLTALPAGLCLLARLEDLDLDNCGLTALPAGIGGLVGLRTLDVSDNEELTALPAGLGRLRNLEVLYLNHCPGLATLQDLRRRKCLPALLAHLAAQGGELAAGEASYI
jgi:hypothetical protein